MDMRYSVNGVYLQEIRTRKPTKKMTYNFNVFVHGNMQVLGMAFEDRLKAKADIVDRLSRHCQSCAVKADALRATVFLTSVLGSKPAKVYSIQKSHPRRGQKIIKGTIEELAHHFGVKPTPRTIMGLVNKIQAEYTRREDCCYERTFVEVAKAEPLCAAPGVGHVQAPLDKNCIHCGKEMK
jgi:hypothetical protein